MLVSNQPLESSPSPKAESWSRKISAFLRRRQIQLFVALSILFQLAGAVPDFWGKLPQSVLNWLWGIHCLGAIIGIVALLADNDRQNYLDDLEKKLKTKEDVLQESEAQIVLLKSQVNRIPAYVYESVSQLLLKMAGEFGLDSTCRISLYSPSGDHFHLKGRYSAKPSQNNKSERIYSRNSGVLGMCWRDGEVFESKLPSPKSDYDGYVAISSEKYGVDPEFVKQLGMKSRSFYAKVVKDAKGYMPVAVLLIESTEANKLQKTKFDEVFFRNHDELRSIVIEMFKGIDIDPELASRVGL